MSAAIEKAKAIRLLILDVDGVLTSGVIYYGSDGREMKGFHIHDGLGIKLLQKTGVIVAIISGKNSEAVSRRIKDLNIRHFYLGQEDKLPAYEDLKQRLKIQDHEIAYMGDDLPDLPLLRRAGLAITVPQAPETIKQHVDYITKLKAGKGAVREACEFIMETQDHYQSVIQSYLI
jgi:3-deoxy-D-manno-octulosonate 8-phosphate phosphatase (KDO 8-P phosphatase)